MDISYAMTSEKLDLATIDQILKAQKARQRDELLDAIKAEWQTHGEIRDRQLFIRIGYSGPTLSAELTEKIHPAAPLAKAVDDVNRAFQILVQSRTALLDSAGRFHSRLLNDKVSDSDHNVLLNDATREVYTYSCAAESLVQAYRHLVSCMTKESATRYADLKREMIDNVPIVRFIKELRNNNNHVQILAASPHYTISWKEKREVTSGIRFNTAAILEGKEFSGATRKWLSARTDLQVIELINEHFKLAAEFHRLVFFRSKIHDDKALRDLGRIKLAIKTIGQKIWLGVVMQQAIPGKLNPYEYLHAWFTQDELERIYSIPDHTEEQLDYMLALRDPLKFCDEDTRRNLIKLFGITTQQPSASR